LGRTACAGDGVLTALIWVGLSGAAFVVLFFLPGFRLAFRIASGLDVRVVAVTSILVSVIMLSVFTSALVAIGRFDGRLVALFAIVASGVSVAPAARWFRTLPREALLLVPVFLVVAIPWVAAAVRPDFAPAETFQWYYWDLGRALSQAGGIPATVREYGWDVRWLPDYIYFNGFSEAFSALMAPVDTAVAMQAWRVPLALAGLGSLYLVARLWLRRSSAVVAAAGTATSFLFLDKFNTYKPESLGIVVGLLAGWLVVMGLRNRQGSWAIVGGVALGADVAIHAIAATVLAFLLVGACLAEIWDSRGLRTRLFAAAATAALITVFVVLATGTALQGRPLVATEASRPVAGRSVDATWTYLEYSSGRFTDRPPPTPAGQLERAARPWPGISLDGLNGVWFAWLAGLALVLVALYGDRQARMGLLAVLLATAALAAGIAYFALFFTTYVPQHTGLVRFAQYIPLVAGFGVGFIFEGHVLAWERITRSEMSRSFGAVAAALALALLIPVTDGEFRMDRGIEEPGQEAIEQLARLAPVGDVVLSNSLTDGTLEFFTDLEAPLEGRQPLLEEPALLDHANATLLAAHRFFGPERDDTILSDLGVGWVLVADQPKSLGATASLGGSVTSAAAEPRLVERWAGTGIALFEVVP
jgi:hypothetical protein